MLEQEGRRGRVHPYFVVAAAATESSLGAQPCRSNPRNVWGLGSCGRSWSPPWFASWRQAIRYYVRFVRERWPTASSPWQLYGYCECGSQWGDAVNRHSLELFGVPSTLRYP